MVVVMCDCDCDYDPPAFYEQKLVRAKKDHTCCECGRTIRATEVYELASGKWDIGVCSYKTCVPCLILWTSLEQETKCRCRIFGELMTELGAACDVAVHRRVDRFNRTISYVLDPE
jgi:hypothetical protein